MTEQEILLKEENQKLNARLTKAIKVFTDQKEEIARLTKERNDAKASLEDSESRIKGLEEKLKANEENDNNFFEQLKEIEKLNNENLDLKNALEARETEITELNKTIENNKIDYESLVSVHNEDLAKIKRLNSILEIEKNTVDEMTKAIDEEYKDIIEKISSLKNPLKHLKECSDNIKNIKLTPLEKQ